MGYHTYEEPYLIKDRGVVEDFKNVLHLEYISLWSLAIKLCIPTGTYGLLFCEIILIFSLFLRPASSTPSSCLMMLSCHWRPGEVYSRDNDRACRTKAVSAAEVYGDGTNTEMIQVILAAQCDRSRGKNGGCWLGKDFLEIMLSVSDRGDGDGEISWTMLLVASPEAASGQ